MSRVESPWLPILVGLTCLVACTGHRQYERRLQVLEQELTDMRTAQRRLNQRLDEVQIELTTIRRQLGPAADGVKIEAPAAGREQAAAAGDEHGEDGLDEQQIAALLQAAEQLLRQGRSEQGEQALSEFLSRFAEHPLAARAYLLRGQAKYADGRYLSARADFGAAAANGDSELAAQALLLAGRCDENLGRMQEAKNTYLQLVQAYPLSREAGEANKRLGALR